MHLMLPNYLCILRHLKIYCVHSGAHSFILFLYYKHFLWPLKKLISTFWRLHRPSGAGMFWNSLNSSPLLKSSTEQMLKPLSLYLNLFLHFGLFLVMCHFLKKLNYLGLLKWYKLTVKPRENKDVLCSIPCGNSSFIISISKITG